MQDSYQEANRRNYFLDKIHRNVLKVYLTLSKDEFPLKTKQKYEINQTLREQLCGLMCLGLLLGLRTGPWGSS